MNVVELYNQFTTTWEKIRANITSHVIAAGLLWLVGFSPPLPDINLADFAKLQAHPAYPIIQGVGFLALLSLGIAFAVGTYAIVLRGVGRLLTTVIMVLMPPVVSFSRSRKLIPRDVLFTIAATLDGGAYQASDLQAQMFKLLANYSATQPDELKKLSEGRAELQRDASTHFNNATAFLAAWIAARWLLPHDSPFALAVGEVFWRGVGVLFIYLLIARARLLFDVHFAVLWSVGAAAMLVQKDPVYKERLAAARKKPEPYNELVDCYLREEVNDEPPSLRAYLRALLARPHAGKKPIVQERRGPVRAAIEDLRRFGSDRKVNRDYKNPAWLARYAGWRAVRLLDLMAALFKAILLNLGLWRPW
jgi:hypothetical protein